jgi:hypothetical protein
MLQLTSALRAKFETCYGTLALRAFDSGLSRRFKDIDFDTLRAFSRCCVALFIETNYMIELETDDSIGFMIKFD